MGSPALDLDDIDPRVWRVRTGETVYGPYTLGQMCQFVREGRVAAHTEIADGLSPYSPAGEVAALSGAFKAMQPADEPVSPAESAPAGQAPSTPTNMLVVLKPVDEAGALMRALAELGPFVEASTGTILLKTTRRIAKVHAALAKAAVPGDFAVIVDAGSNRIAWLGLDPSRDSALRALWDETPL